MKKSLKIIVPIVAVVVVIGIIVGIIFGVAVPKKRAKQDGNILAYVVGNLEMIQLLPKFEIERAWIDNINNYSSADVKDSAEYYSSDFYNFSKDKEPKLCEVIVLADVGTDSYLANFYDGVFTGRIYIGCTFEGEEYVFNGWSCDKNDFIEFDFDDELEVSKEIIDTVNSAFENDELEDVTLSDDITDDWEDFIEKVENLKTKKEN